MPFARLKSGLKLHYQRVGQGPDVVMIHGLTGNLAVWHLKIIPLLMHQFRMTTYDLRGHGFSQMTPTGYTGTDMANDLLDLLDVLEIDQLDIVGHSFGADVALYFAYYHPERVRRVVALEASLPAMMQVRSQSNWEGWTYWADVLEKSGVPVPPERRSDVDYLIRLSLQSPRKWGPLNGLPRDPKPFLRLLDTTTMVRDYAEVGELTLDNLTQVETPVHLVYVEESAFLHTYECLRARLPNTHTKLLPRTEWGHFGPLEQPERVAEYLKNALAPDTSIENGHPAASDNQRTTTQRSII